MHAHPSANTYEVADPNPKAGAEAKAGGSTGLGQRH
jgi:hypothetical protein